LNRWLAAIVFVCAFTVSSGCVKKNVPPTEPFVSMYGGRIPDSQRFIAVRHKLQIVASETQLPKAWESVINFCATLHCEVLNSSITARTRESLPSAAITLRVAPEDAQKLMDQVEKQGSVVQHITASEDKTSEVVDTDAKIKNLTSFRDNLRTMLAKPSAAVKDSVEIQQQLTDIQSQLDSETAQRKILANQTEKIAVEISFRIERNPDGSGGFKVIGDALRESGAVLAESTASLIIVIVVVIPWLIVIVPVFWVLRKMWRKFRGSRHADRPPTASAL
jgi:hypothetical protein